MWIRHKQGRILNYAPDDLHQAQVRRQRGWTEDDVLIFLRLNLMVATFEWAEILAQAATDREEGCDSSIANALIYAHTNWRTNAFREHCRINHYTPEKTIPGTPGWESFVKLYDADKTAEQLIRAWKDSPPRAPAHSFLADTNNVGQMLLWQDDQDFQDYAPDDSDFEHALAELELIESR
ncbi:uncharacterized protein FIBRA_00369 [Fibroporia radiculosa]|uniref:Uncharacterized protein n=1 Tax=Fibroporia radiculosa TaxID=599839 RepID=J7S617_9APHY|nr:uncharacterized protein FIBRA_00369 [Fibroporia radiculosa]CCL98374.1 predicted protein [Fibroporia radiculosa]